MSNEKSQVGLAKLKKEVRSLIISSPQGLTLKQFLKDYKDSIGKSFPYLELGYDSIYNLLSDMSDVVRYDNTKNGYPAVLIPVTDEKVNHINALVSRQKQAPVKHYNARLPRKSIQGEISKPRSIASYNKNLFWDGDSRHGEHMEHIKTLESSSHNGTEEASPLSDDEFERPPTPGELIITEKMKNDFRELLADFYPEGILSSKFCSRYKEKYGVPLRYAEYGLKSFKEMIVNLPDVFSFSKSSGDWFLYDASKPLPASDVPSRWIPNFIQGHLADLAQAFPQGLKKNELLVLYKERYNAELNFERLGFDSIQSFLQSCLNVEVVKIDGEDIVLPNVSCQSNNVEQESAFPVLPPVSEISYLWNNHFSTEECNPSMNYHPFQLADISKLNYAKVYACDVISPSRIWIQIDESREDLDKLMYNLNEYYNQFEYDHLLSNTYCNFIDLICAVKFNWDNRWHRAKIIGTLEPDQVEVLYIDYGTVNVVSVSCVRKLHRQFYDLPVQAILVSLYGLTYLPEFTSWPLTCIDYTYNLVFEHKFNITVMEIDSAVPEMKIVLYDLDNKDSLSINDQLIASGHAISLGHTNQTDPEHEERTRTPPGYTSGAVSFRTSKKNICSSSSTCDRIRDLREDAAKLQQEAEFLLETAKHKWEEADVLEKHVCKHLHPNPSGNIDFEKVQEELTEFSGSSNNFNISSSRVNFDPTTLGTGLHENPGNGLTLPRRSPSMLNQTRSPAMPIDLAQNSQMVFGQSQNTTNGYSGASGVSDGGFKTSTSMPKLHQMVQGPHQVPQQTPVNYQPGFLHPQVSEIGFSSVPPHITQQPQMTQRPHVHHQPGSYPHFTYPPQMLRPMMPNNMVVPPLYMNPSYPPCQPQQGMNYPMNSSQWGPQIPPRFSPYSPDIARMSKYSSSIVRSSFAPVTPSESSQMTGPTHTVENVQQQSPTSAENIQDPDVPLEPVTESASHDTKPDVHVSEICEEPHETEISETGPTVNPPIETHSLTPAYETSHLTEKQCSHFEKTEDISLPPPPTNNWSELLPSNLTSDSDSNLMDVLENSLTTLVDLIKKDEIVSDEHPRTDENHIEESQGVIEDVVKVVNHIMKVTVGTICNTTFNMNLLLVEDIVCVLLKQLYACFWSGDPCYEEASYSKFTSNLQESGLPAYSISYTDYTILFEQMLEEKILDKLDAYTYVVNLSDVLPILDAICPTETDLERMEYLCHMKEMFGLLSRSVLPEDIFWYRK